MIDRAGLIASDFGRSRAWYEAALATTGYAMLMELAAVADRPPLGGFGDKAAGGR